MSDNLAHPEKPAATPPKLLDQVGLRLKYCSIQTAQAYVIGWIKRYIIFHNKQPPAEMGQLELGHIPGVLAMERSVSAPIQIQALFALLFS